MAGPAGPVVGDVLRAVGVVEDQQPAVPATQLGQQPVHGGGDRRSGRQVQPGGEPGELVGDEHRLFGVDPPHQVVVGGEPVRVLDRQLGLAHPAQPVQRLHHQRRLTGAQPPPQLGEHAVAAGEPRIPRRHPPHRRPAAGESRPAAGRRIRPRKRRRAGRAQPGQPAAQPGRGRGLVQPGQVQGDQRGVQRGQGDRLDEHRHDPPLGGAVPGERGAQLGAAERGGEVGLGAHRQQPVRGLQRRGHAGHEVLSRSPVPHSQLDGVPGLLQLPGQPLRPRGVAAGVADEEIGRPAAHAPALSHHPRYARPSTAVEESSVARLEIPTAVHPTRRCIQRRRPRRREEHEGVGARNVVARHATC